MTSIVRRYSEDIVTSLSTEIQYKHYYYYTHKPPNHIHTLGILVLMPCKDFMIKMYIYVHNNR